jgi:hypothetical protein
MVPIPRAASFAELNAKLLEHCRRRWGDRLRGHAETIGERLVAVASVHMTMLSLPVKHEARIEASLLLSVV